MTAKIEPGQFICKYTLGEIVEMKQTSSGFLGKVLAVTFYEDAKYPLYCVRRVDGVVITLSEHELCIRGVDHEIEEYDCDASA